MIYQNTKHALVKSRLWFLSSIVIIFVDLIFSEDIPLFHIYSVPEKIYNIFHNKAILGRSLVSIDEILPYGAIKSSFDQSQAQNNCWSKLKSKLKINFKLNFKASQSLP